MMNARKEFEAILNSKGLGGTQHTPGPWKVHGKPAYTGFRIADSNGKSLASFPSTSTRPDAEREANARLIAAAPRLLAALRTARNGLTERQRELEPSIDALLQELGG